MMSVTRNHFFCLMILILECKCEDVDFGTFENVTNLAPYGYKYDVSRPFNSFTFKVKCCYEAYIWLFESEDASGNNYLFILGGWGNTKVAIICDDHVMTRNVSQSLSCDEYRYFWISWRNRKDVVLGRGNEVFQDVLLTLNQSYCGYLVRSVGIGDIFSQGQWKIPRLSKGQQWRVFPMFKNVNMTSQVSWRVESSNPGACGIQCRNDPSCVSFTFNANKRLCQGHSETFTDLTEGQGHIEHGSHYFI
ncbi:uncharacterized protein [Argopecten irradians]|uniref:uncharacterized protein n=1 Tax=Argopecten irradians TaxID=31199 RepID=UPI00371B5939